MGYINITTTAAKAFNCAYDGDTTRERHTSLQAGVEVTIVEVKDRVVFISCNGLRYRMHINIAKAVFPLLRSLWQNSAVSIISG